MRLILIFQTTLVLLSCGSKKSTLKDTSEAGSTVDDTFAGVKICEQIWMKRNLNVAVFRNGDTIPEARSAVEWNNAGKEKRPAWCYYNNDPKMGEKYGKLYNWFAVNDPRGLAPVGWHIPTEEEWWTLRECIKEPYNEHSEKIKSNTDDWHPDTGINSKGNDSTGFSAFPAGQRQAGVKSNFTGFSFFADFWSSTKKSYGAYYIRLVSTGNFIYGSPTGMEMGLSVRCIRDVKTD